MFLGRNIRVILNRTNQGPLIRTLSRRRQHCLRSVQPQEPSTARVWINGASMPTVVPHLDKFMDPSPAQVSDQNDEFPGRGGGGDQLQLTDDPSIGVPSVRVKFPTHFNFSLFNYLGG